MGNENYLPWDKAALGYEADHLSLSSALVKNEWSSTFILHVCLHVVYRDNFIFCGGRILPFVFVCRRFVLPVTGA